MKLAFCLFKYFPYGGLQKDFFRLAAQCISRGHQVDVYTGSWTGDRPDNFQINIIPPRGLTNHQQYLSFARRVNQLISEDSYDAVVGFNKMPGLDVYFASDGCYAARAAGKIFLYRLSRRFRILRYLEQTVFDPGSNTKILSISDTQKQSYINHYGTPDKRFYPVPPWLSKHLVDGIGKPGLRQGFRREFSPGMGSFILLMVGSGFKTKGVDRAIRAVAALPYHLKEKTVLVIAGRGKPRPYGSLAKRLGCSSSIHFVGERDDVASFLAGADLLLHPARHEAAGTVLIEAMAAGLPVLATDVCGFAGHVTSAGGGKLVPSPFRQKTLNDMLAAMMSCKTLVQLGQNGKQYIEKTDVYSRHQRAADIIEKVAFENQ